MRHSDLVEPSYYYDCDFRFEHDKGHPIPDYLNVNNHGYELLLQ
jgi:hypothetical protein